jgi:aminoglycoside phosphotransferase (APT) family kinase protein
MPDIDLLVEATAIRHRLQRLLGGEDLPTRVPGRPGIAPARAPERGMAVESVPQDLGLPQLAELLDPARVADVLPWDAIGALRGSFGDIDMALLRYQPARRATVRCTLAGRHGNAPRVLYGKTFCDDQAAALDRRFSYFWRQGGDASPSVPRPLGCGAMSHTFWQAAAAGVPLLEGLRALPFAKAAARMRGVARAIANVHAAPTALASGMRPRLVAHRVAEARRWQSRLASMDPAAATPVARLVESIEAHAPRQAARPLTVIHGDFHPERVWLDGLHIVLLDLDHLTLGDPMEDLAAFLLKLAGAGLPGEHLSALIESYAAHAPGHFDPACLDWHLAQQGFVHACRALASQRGGR